MEHGAATAPLPDAFLHFLESNGIDPSIYTSIDSTPRYIRLKPGFEDCIEDVESEIKCKPKKLEWLLGFYTLPPHIQIASTNAYREGKIYGIDASSGAAVMALGISPGDHVLDLCAAPGIFSVVLIAKNLWRCLLASSFTLPEKDRLSS